MDHIPDEDRPAMGKAAHAVATMPACHVIVTPPSTTIVCPVT